MPNDQQWVAFRIAQQPYALPVAAVRAPVPAASAAPGRVAHPGVVEIVRVPHITPVPSASSAPGHIAGVTNLRGRIIPVVDLRKKLGIQGLANEAQTGALAEFQIPNPEPSPLKPHDSRLAKARVLVLMLDGKLIGMLVDEASEVLRIAASDIDPNPIPPGRDAEDGDSYVSGIARHQGRLIVLLDAEKLLGRLAS